MGKTPDRQQMNEQEAASAILSVCTGNKKHANIGALARAVNRTHTKELKEGMAEAVVRHLRKRQLLRPDNPICTM